MVAVQFSSRCQICPVRVVIDGAMKDRRTANNADRRVMGGAPQRDFNIVDQAAPPSTRNVLRNGEGHNSSSSRDKRVYTRAFE